VKILTIQNKEDVGRRGKGKKKKTIIYKKNNDGDREFSLLRAGTQSASERDSLLESGLYKEYLDGGRRKSNIEGLR